MNYLKDVIIAFLPEIILALFGCFALLISLLSKKRREKTPKALCFGGIATALTSVSLSQTGTLGFFSNSVVTSEFTTFLKTLILIGAFLCVLIFGNFLQKQKGNPFRVVSVFLFLILASACLISANNFGILFVCTLIISLLTAKFIAFASEDKNAQRKYYAVSGVSLLFILGGITYIFWFYRVFNFEQISQYLVQFYPTVGFSIALIFIAAGLLFNVLAAPFCLVFPDIFEKTNHVFPVVCTTILPVAGFAAIIKLLSVFGTYSLITNIALMLLASLTLVTGITGMIRRHKMTGFLGYSAVAHSGFMLIGICSLYLTNMAAILFYLLCYIFMNIGVWSAVCIYNESNNPDEVEGYKGLFFKRPFYVGAFSVCLFALAGMPVTSGFLSKLYLFMAMARSGLVYLLFLIFTMLSAVVAAYAYLRVIRLFYESSEHLNKLHNRLPLLKYVLYFSTVVTILLCIFARPLINLCKIVTYST